jgi:hypothetical protein
MLTQRLPVIPQPFITSLAMKRPHEAKIVSSSANDAPAPFSRLPVILEPLTVSLSPRHAYVVYVDRKPAISKRQIFMVLALVHALLAVLLLWRAVYAIPTTNRYWHRQFFRR